MTAPLAPLAPPPDEAFLRRVLVSLRFPIGEELSPLQVAFAEAYVAFCEREGLLLPVRAA